MQLSFYNKSKSFYLINQVSFGEKEAPNGEHHRPRHMRRTAWAQCRWAEPSRIPAVGGTWTLPEARKIPGRANLIINRDPYPEPALSAANVSGNSSRPTKWGRDARRRSREAGFVGRIKLRKLVL